MRTLERRIKETGLFPSTPIPLTLAQSHRSRGGGRCAFRQRKGGERGVTGKQARQHSRTPSTFLDVERPGMVPAIVSGALRGARCAVRRRGAGCEVRGAMCEVWDAGCGMRGAGCGTRGARCAVRGVRSAVRGALLISRVSLVSGDPWVGGRSHCLTLSRSEPYRTLLRSSERPPGYGPSQHHEKRSRA